MLYNYNFNPTYPQAYNNSQMNGNYVQNSSLIRVTGLDGAKAYQMPPNSTVALFDNNNDIFYVKSTDGAGFPTIRAFQFVSYDIEQEQNDYVSRKEYNELIKKIEELTSQISNLNSEV